MELSNRHPQPFGIVINQLNLNKEECLVGGNSPMRDLGRANAASIDCVLAGGAMGKQSVGSFPSLAKLAAVIK